MTSKSFKSSTKRVLSMLEDLANSDDEGKKEKYRTFWAQFGQVLKEGVEWESANQERILKLLRLQARIPTLRIELFPWLNMSLV